jgi:hypothetical protein
MNTIRKQVLKRRVKQLLYWPNRKTRASQTTIKQCNIYMTKQLYTTQWTGPAILIVRALRRAILVAYNQPRLNQLDGEVFIVRSNFSCNSTEFFIL